MLVISYHREFSALRGLQPQRTLEYQLLGSEEGTPGIRFCERAADGVERVSLTSLAGYPSSAPDLLTYLYENAVPFDQGEDVIADIWNRIGTGQRERNGRCCDPTAYCG